MYNFSTQFAVEEFELALVASVLAALISFYFFYRSWKRLRFIENTPTAKLRSAHQGYIEVEGKGQCIDGQLIYAPLSNHLCIWYHSKIERKETFVHKGRTQSRWNLIYQNTSPHQFKLTDGTSSCFVDPTGAEIHSNEQLVWYGDNEWPTLTKILASQSILLSSFNRYRYSEKLILPGQSLYIIGQFTTLSAVTRQSVRDAMYQLITDWKQDPAQLLKRFDSNKDGQIDQLEWEAARQQAFEQAQTIYHEQAMEPDTHLMMKPTDNTRPFIISIHSQARLIKKYRYYTYAASTACLTVMGYMLWLIHAYE